MACRAPRQHFLQHAQFWSFDGLMIVVVVMGMMNKPFGDAVRDYNPHSIVSQSVHRDVLLRHLASMGSVSCCLCFAGSPLWDPASDLMLLSSSCFAGVLSPVLPRAQHWPRTGRGE
jgi:hypothetical protein